MLVYVPISPGELLDKLSILEIKSERIAEADKLANVRRELSLLENIWRQFDAEDAEIRVLRNELRRVNERLWEIEDAIREREARADFGPEFLELARSVYQNNDQRALVKRRINEALGSEIFEEKSYPEYSETSGPSG